jgi:F-type H+-transporting ATPase subunit gamma
MPSPRELREHIRSITSTAKITRAMQMVAASKMRKAQQATLMTRPAARMLYRIQRHATAHASDFTHPLLAVRPVRKRAVILVGTDKGLCGALNTNLFRVAAEFDPASTVFITAGKRASQFIARTERRLVAEFTFGDTPRMTDARPIASFARDLFLKGEVDEVKVVFTVFVNTMVQNAVAVPFLPVGEIAALKLPGLESEDALASDAGEVQFEPSPQKVLSYLLENYLNILIYRVLLEAKASEQSARMVSMKNATDRTTELTDELTLEYNKMRQGSITRELLDIAGGQLGDA